jgi:hypothetical protein
MNYTSWHNASTISTYDVEGIQFTDGDSVLDNVRDLITVDNLVGVAAGQRVSLSGSNALLFSGWRFDVAVPLIVEVRILAQRYARIVDTVVRLTNGVAAGDNVADLEMSNDKTYSGLLSSYWRAGVDVRDPRFGLILDFAPRDDMPSSNPLILRSVQMRIGY